ncbi:glycosyltransferase family 4 protein [Lentisphaera profundi]|uniref:Glycosyltransferase family 4 protein n=1 Tax=Lentisphaera profundi TaxID=1658616 RepID=A0ABY7VQ94_9BACT|nr:glycosyltransferase family 4 protein [Lentisphaera profundi]WDE96167.1 glycosyltransferase family 4 protein [Lentisphaera profundi]
MKIAHIITRMIIGGAQENTLLSCMGQVRDGHEVFLITGPTSGPEGELLKKHDTEGLKIIEVPDLIRSINPLKDLRCYYALRQIIKDEKFDVVHTHASKAGIIGRAAAWKEKVSAVIHTVHGPPFHRYEKAWKNKIYIESEKFAAKRCHQLLCVADAMTDQYVEAAVAPREKFKTVHSGMNLEPYTDEPDVCGVRKAVREELNLADDAIVVVKVARLFELKGHDFLLDAAEAVCKKHPQLHFILVGDGLLRSEIEADLEQRGLTDRFRFTGLVLPTEVPRYVIAADILCHLSLREGLPRAVVQGLAAAKPAIVFNLDGAPEVVKHNVTGYLCEAENLADVEAALVELCESPQKRQSMGQAGRDLVKKLFSTNRMVKRLEEEYEILLGKSAK